VVCCFGSRSEGKEDNGTAKWNAFGREARETSIAQPAYWKLHWAQVKCSAGNGIHETLVTASSENELSAGNSARHRRIRKRWSGKIIMMSQ
jgi:hypothetical protein